MNVLIRYLYQSNASHGLDFEEGDPFDRYNLLGSFDREKFREAIMVIELGIPIEGRPGYCEHGRNGSDERRHLKFITV